MSDLKFVLLLECSSPHPVAEGLNERFDYRPPRQAMEELAGILGVPIGVGSEGDASTQACRHTAIEFVQRQGSDTREVQRLLSSSRRKAQRS